LGRKKSPVIVKGGPFIHDADPFSLHLVPAQTMKSLRYCPVRQFTDKELLIGYTVGIGSFQRFIQIS